MKSATTYSSHESYPSGRSRLATIVGSAGLVLLVAGVIWFITPPEEPTNHDKDTVDTPQEHRMLPSRPPREDLPEPPEIRPEDVTDQPPAEQDSHE